MNHDMAYFPEYESFDALGLADLVRRGEVTPAELADAARERIACLNPALNAVVCTFDAEGEPPVPATDPSGPFQGVPFLLKDLGVHCRGVATVAGSRYLANAIAPRDSTITERYRAAGLQILGKTNTPEMGLVAVTEPVYTGPTLNPWNPKVSAGGSSGGSAVAVAAGMVPMANANDGGGSIRIPAAHCGLFGLKPTRARTPVGPDVGEVWSGLTVYHAVTRSVRDSAALLDATAGAAPGDPYAAPPPKRPYLAEIGRDPGRLRVAVTVAAPGGYPVHADCVAAAEDTARLCEDLGHHVEIAAPFFDLAGLIPHFRTIWGANLVANLAQYRRAGMPIPGPSDLETITRLIAADGADRTASDYVEALRAFHRVGRDHAAFFADYDVLITPCLTQPPWPLGAIDMMGDSLDGFVEALFAHQAFTPQFNVTGQPAASLPLYWSKDGLPIGVQIAARFGEEGVLFRLSSQLETACPWFARRPPMASEHEPQMVSVGPSI